MANDEKNINQGFEEPPERELREEDVEEEAGPEEFEEEGGEEPPEEGEEEAPAEEEDQLVEVEERLIQIRGEIEEQLLQQPYDEEGGVEAEDACEAVGNIVGVDYGFVEDSANGFDPGSIVLNVYLVEPMSVGEVKSVIVDSMGVSAASSDDVPVNPVVSGVIYAQSHRFRIRPAPGGVSVGHYRITAGTLGCLARGRRGRRTRRLLILSNNHVLANTNIARFGDSIVQPGPYDGGRSPRDRIAILERFVPIRFGRGRVNYVDAATGWAWSSRVRRDLVYLSRGRRRFFRISSRIRSCRRGLYVGKSGRTTQLQVGRIVSCNWSGWVNYGRGRRAFFRDQMTIRGLRENFSSGGDSGSSIWTWDRRRNPVGLLFAGGGGLTIASKMWRVLRSLDINLYT